MQTVNDFRNDRVYREDFDHGPGGWFGWTSNAAGPHRLPVENSCLVLRSPWWIDYNHAPPGAGYLHLLAILLTRGPFGEHQREIAGDNRFVGTAQTTDLLNATVTIRLKGEVDRQGAQMCLLVQAVQNGICSGWVCSGQPFDITPDFTTQSIVLDADRSNWTPLGSRHDRIDFYGELPLEQVLSDVNTNVLLVLFPLNVVPMGPLNGDPHRLRPEKDYPVWRHRLPEGYVLLDSIEIRHARSSKTLG
jgi:hypothetical protein